jgi:hypothetical protein
MLNAIKVVTDLVLVLKSTGKHLHVSDYSFNGDLRNRSVRWNYVDESTGKVIDFEMYLYNRTPDGKYHKNSNDIISDWFVYTTIKECTNKYEN